MQDTEQPLAITTFKTTQSFHGLGNLPLELRFLIFEFSRLAARRIKFEHDLKGCDIQYLLPYEIQDSHLGQEKLGEAIADLATLV